MPDAPPRQRPIGYAVFLVIAGLIGLLAAFELTVEKINTLAEPDYNAACNVGILVSCSTNLGSWQGSVFGFPNPLIGLMAWPCVVVVGVSLLAGARFPRWFHAVFNLGVAGALAFVIWLIGQSIYVLGVLCPWCMLTWSVTIPLFVAVTAGNLAGGVFGGGERTRRVGSVILSWTWVIALVGYAVVILLAQLRLDAIPTVIRELQNYYS
ncbi:vitamin K epoxide reductase family protein [Agromyces seonyuensis]|uniref:Vitamin K epoxide reductase domain-containing protein n=1 Tax=Agromyces seonyuensis TaxID=2662446 RepID=A0A6I4NTT2_9MICO|nr:vitamin K epoxide reductase family protein [Agromyces seonyuensis]MWB97798.1 hypothetical protein [Agromyces seonyuensis]